MTTVTVNDRMQRNYRYQRTAPIGRNFDPEFRPELTPAEMLRLGVFGGKYMTDCADEFPASWFRHAKLSPRGSDPALNCFGVDASQRLSEWRRKGWIHPDDPRGWFQWYCRYTMGRRVPEEDRRQIRRWKAMRRHVRQIETNCAPGDMWCRRRQRKALLHWPASSAALRGSTWRLTRTCRVRRWRRRGLLTTRRFSKGRQDPPKECKPHE